MMINPNASKSIWADAVLNKALNLENSDAENSDAVNTMLDKFGLNWKVGKMPLSLPNGGVTPFWGIVRLDNYQTFATAKEGYTPYQNSELSELLIRLSESTGYTPAGGGSFNGGAKVYVQLESPNRITNLGLNNDTVRGYLTGINSHDGSTSLCWGETNVTVSCTNTFMAAMRELKQRARHTEKIRDKVELALRELEGVIKFEKTLFDKLINLSEIQTTKTDIAKIVRKVTGVDMLLTREELAKNYTTYSVNRAEELLSAIASEMGEKGNTQWGLFSGVTKYSNYIMPTPKRENARLESLYTGSGMRVNNDAFLELTS